MKSPPEELQPLPGGRLPEEPPDALRDVLGYLLAKAHSGLRAIAEPSLEELGMGVKEFGTLSVLTTEGPHSQQRLGERLQVDRTTMVAVIDRLEQSGYVERRRNPDDRRAYAVVPTPKGRHALERAREVVSGAEREFLARIPAADRRRLKDVLRTLISP